MKIGPSFSSKLEAAGLLGLPFSWGEDGDIQFDESMTQEQRDAVTAVFDAHDPSAPAPPAPLSPTEQRLNDLTVLAVGDPGNAQAKSDATARLVALLP